MLLNYKILMKNKIILFIVSIILISCAKSTPREPVTRKSSTFLNESIKRNKKVNKLEEEAFLELIKNDSTHQYISSANGFWYTYLKKNKDSNAVLPIKGDQVIYSYSIKDINRQVLYNEEELGERNYLVDKQELITGLQDGLKLMKEGEKVVFLFPSHKAYGYSGYKKIGINQPLIYTVTLKKIISKNEDK